MFTIKELVKMENDTRQIAGIEYKKLVQIFNSYIGQKIQKKDHSIIKKIKDQIQLKTDIKIEPLRPGGFTDITNYLTTSAYSISLNIKICYSGGSYDNNTAYCEYYETLIYICDVHTLTLLKTYSHPDTVFINCEEQENFIKEAQKLKEQLEITTGKVFYRLQDKI
jgi:hypothetical protein